MSKVFDIFEKENLVEHVKNIGIYLNNKLNELSEKYSFIVDHRGMGLMQGLEFDRPVGPVVNKALEQGLLLISAGSNIIRFVPPLIITEKNVDEMISILDSVLAKL